MQNYGKKIQWNTFEQKLVRFFLFSSFSGDWGSVSSPASAASTLLSEACVKRRGVLNNIMPFCIHILSSESSPIEKDAVLHMYIAIAEILLKKAAYKVCSTTLMYLSFSLN